MDEYIKVVFPTRRKVRVDGKAAGFTNRVFQVETGHHNFDLGDKPNYRPKKKNVEVINTQPSAPMVLIFEQAEEER
jgi:hypothetical protein